MSINLNKAKISFVTIMKGSVNICAEYNCLMKDLTARCWLDMETITGLSWQAIHGEISFPMDSIKIYGPE